MSFLPASHLSKQRKASEYKSMDFPILQESEAREGGSGKMSKGKQFIKTRLNIPAITI